MEKLEPSYFAIIPANVRYDDDLTPNAKLLYGEITALCSMKGHCWATNEYFSNLYKVSKVSISKWVNQLIKKGYINSEYKYKEGTKEIEYRYLTIVNTQLTNINDPIKEKLNTPIKEKFKDNNTLINNTNNNNTSDKSEDVEVVCKKYKELKNLPEVHQFTTQRKKAIKARVNSEGLETVIAVLEMLDKDNYYSEENRKGATWYHFNYIFNPEKFNMLVERKNKLQKSSYNNNNTNSNKTVNNYEAVNINNLFGGTE